MDFDVLIIGAGAAGLSCALVLLIKILPSVGFGYTLILDFSLMTFKVFMD